MILTRALTSFSRLPRFAALALFCSVAIFAAGPAAHAALINYGDFPVPSAGITFQQVTESSGTDPVPLYGPPTSFVVGLDFNPASFVSSSSGGNADITDGQLNFGVQGQTGPGGSVGISSFNLFESGDYSLLGAGTPATSVFAGAIITVTVSEINGLPVVPFNLPASNASVGFNLVANPGIAQPWNLGVGVPINLPIGQVATKISVSVDNSLASISQPGTIAFIAKKDFRITLTPSNPTIPEPGTLVLTAFGSMIALVYRRARS
ncbi:MAG TPA: hypothetical protein VH107_10675 [Lacipirellulaceae bacterium]|jgi:hypothetical protein|nr:hypothetical protein [Lacipirellulaceae bacterium]